MKLVFYSIVLNHHQACLADAFYRILGSDYCFVETAECHDNKGALEDYSKRPYLLQAWKSAESYEQAMRLALTADTCVFGGYEALPFEKARLQKGMMSFDMSERWLKRGLLNILSPRVFKMLTAYKMGGWGKLPVYKLCMSAFAADDQHRLFTYREKCYKWGYFTDVEDICTVEAPEQGVSTSETLHTLMWCARFLKLKHPELPVKLAARLKTKGYNFVVDMYGSGRELEPTKALAKQLGVDDVVRFNGNKPNAEILEAMRHHEIFLFTSDKNEGWGAVANESMANGCALVASDAIGSTPYLVKDGCNGFRFKSCDVVSLAEKVEWLLNHYDECQQMRHNAYLVMKNVWSPSVAAKNLLNLIDNLQHGRDTAIKEGPCSKA